ncbi:MAG: thiol-disulfide oxidoreductase DCC family protein [Pseudohongiellaceae bacterium]
MQSNKLTLFFDSYCPLCAAEMEMLKEYDAAGRLEFQDIHSADFSENYPTIDPIAADRVLHGQYEDGTMIYGLDVTHQAWRAVNKKPWIGVLRWPIIRWFADIGYRIFAKNRYSISWALTGKKRCEPCGKLPSTAATGELKS